MSQRHRDWPRVCISDVCESIIDCVNKTATTVAEVTPYKMIRTTNVKGGWVNLSEVRYVSEEVFTKWTRRQVPKRGDVILTREAPLGEVGMLRSNDQVFLGQRLVSYRAEPRKLDNRFLLYSFQSADLQAQFKALGSGATVEHIRVPDCEKWILHLPPLNEQHRIASILSAYDNLIENNTRRIAILEEMARRLYEEWFVRIRFPGHEQVRMVESELGLIPEGWSTERIGNLIEFKKGKKPDSVAVEQTNSLLRHLLIDALRGGSRAEFVSPEKMVGTRTDDTIMVMDGSGSSEVFIGHEGVIGSTLGRYRVLPESGIHPLWLFLFFISNQ